MQIHIEKTIALFTLFPHNYMFILVAATSINCYFCYTKYYLRLIVKFDVKLYI